MLPNSFSTSSSTSTPSSTSASSREELQLKAGPDGIGDTESPSELVLRSIETRVLKVDPEQTPGLSAMPMMLILMVKAWPIEKEAMQQVLTNHYLHDEMQKLYLKNLQPELAQQSTSPISSFQHTVCRKPKWVQMGSEGEKIFNWALKLKAASATEADYVSSILKRSDVEMRTANPDALRNAITGIGLALGGTTMAPASRDALLTRILGNSETCGPEQMAAMTQGLCNAFGYRDMHSPFLQAVSGQILNSYKTTSPAQVGAMMQALCVFLGGERMSPENRDAVVAQILGVFATGTWTMAETAGVVLALGDESGGAGMSPEMRDVILASIRSS